MPSTGSDCQNDHVQLVFGHGKMMHANFHKLFMSELQVSRLSIVQLACIGKLCWPFRIRFSCITAEACCSLPTVKVSYVSGDWCMDHVTHTFIVWNSWNQAQFDRRVLIHTQTVRTQHKWLNAATWAEKVWSNKEYFIQTTNFIQFRSMQFDSLSEWLRSMTSCTWPQKKW